MKRRRDIPDMTRHELRVLTFWAHYGVERALGGSYQKEAPSLIQFWASRSGRNCSVPQFGKFCRVKAEKEGLGGGDGTNGV